MLRDSFRSARQQYSRVGLASAADKRAEGQPGGVALGTEILRDGICGAERLRRMALGLASSAVAAQRVTTGALMRRLMAGWVHCLGYRRVMMCILTRR